MEPLQTEPVAVIGLGAMGSELARVLIERGHRVTLWNRTPEKAQSLVKRGGTLAGSVAEAIASSPVIVICIKTHTDTKAILDDPDIDLNGKTIIELSTGSAAEAAALESWLNGRGARCLIGMICTFPKGIGLEESAIVTVGDEYVWNERASMLKQLAGKSTFIGANVAALAALFGALFLPRQGFMFGMIYGALLCEKAGISIEDYIAQIPLTLSVVHDYYDVFAATVPSQDFEDPPASIGTYQAAFQDVLETCANLNVPTEMADTMHQLIQRGIKAGAADKQVTVLTEILRRT